MDVTIDEISRVLAQSQCLYSQPQVDQAFDRMAAGIGERLSGSNPLVLVVMTGGLIPAGHLLLRLGFPLQIDYIHVTRYRGETSGGELHWERTPKTSVTGRHVLLVDDILDEGLTLKALVDYCETQDAEEVMTAVLVDKQHDRKTGMSRATFTGLSVEDRYVFGSGMDYKGYLRNIAGIHAVKDG